MFDVTQRPAPNNLDIDKKEQPNINHCESWIARIRQAVSRYKL
jgi:hypothetical protein